MVDDSEAGESGMHDSRVDRRTPAAPACPWRALEWEAGCHIRRRPKSPSTTPRMLGGKERVNRAPVVTCALLLLHA